LGMGGINPPGGRPSSITAPMAGADVALDGAHRGFSYLPRTAGAPRQPFPKCNKIRLSGSSMAIDNSYEPFGASITQTISEMRISNPRSALNGKSLGLSQRSF
jgi:hypothetical protein